MEVMKMNDGNQIPMDVSQLIPPKRKRGRPRKIHPSYPVEKPLAPQHVEMKKRQRRKKIDSSIASFTDSAFVGQTVHGVLDGSFDAGYLLTVRVGDTDTVLRGVVFEPGLSVPISKSNDIAPNVKLTRREENLTLPPTTVSIQSPNFAIMPSTPVPSLPMGMSSGSSQTMTIPMTVIHSAPSVTLSNQTGSDMAPPNGFSPKPGFNNSLQANETSSKSSGSLSFTHQPHSSSAQNIPFPPSHSLPVQNVTISPPQYGFSQNVSQPQANVASAQAVNYSQPPASIPSENVIHSQQGTSNEAFSRAQEQLPRTGETVSNTQQLVTNTIDALPDSQKPVTNTVENIPCSRQLDSNPDSSIYRNLQHGQAPHDSSSQPPKNVSDPHGSDSHTPQQFMNHRSSITHTEEHGLNPAHSDSNAHMVPSFSHTQTLVPSFSEPVSKSHQHSSKPAEQVACTKQFIPISSESFRQSDQADTAIPDHNVIGYPKESKTDTRELLGNTFSSGIPSGNQEVVRDIV